MGRALLYKGPAQKLAKIMRVCEVYCVSAQQANPFGQPFLFQIEDDETLDQVKPRIQVSCTPHAERFMMQTPIAYNGGKLQPLQACWNLTFDSEE